MPEVILASGSPRRKKLLEKTGMNFKVITADVSEDYNHDLSPHEIVRTLALRKAQKVAGSHNNVLVIGADTLVVFEGTILEKPESSKIAVKMLNSLSGNVHEVLTGVSLIKTGAAGTSSRHFTFSEQTKVHFGHPDQAAIEAYVQTGSPMDKAGAYGIQDGIASMFVKGIEGDYYNVVGFPIYRFYQHLKDFAPEFYPKKLRETNL